MIRLGGIVGDGFKLGKMDVKYGQVVSNPFARAFTPTNEGEENRKKEGPDHEVFMAQSQLNTIIKSAQELKEKMGDEEKNIPAWIQDHLSKAESYISQASNGYYEYTEGLVKKIKKAHNIKKVNEVRKVGQIQIDLDKILKAVEGEIEKYKKLKGKPEARTNVENLKKLNMKKKELHKELDLALKALHQDVELDIDNL